METLFYILAGEPSGDVLGAALVRALRQRRPDLRFAGIGGDRMADEGVRSLVPISDLAVMGVAEVLPKARRVFAIVRETVAAIERDRPAAVITIDSSGFTFRVAKALRGANTRSVLIHYVAPMVWVWRAGRVRKMARWYDQLMTLLPFEPRFFAASGLPTRHVGHPVLESGAGQGDGAAFRVRHGIPAGALVLAVLPGSRRGEVAKLAPIFSATLSRLRAQLSDREIVAVIPTVSSVAALVAQQTADWPGRTVLLSGVGDKYDAFAASDVALAASGTVALELAMARVPMVVAYRISPITAEIVRRVRRTPYACLVNVLLDRPLVPELLQGQCRPDLLAPALMRLVTDGEAARLQRQGASEAIAMLGQGGPSPSLAAADCVLAAVAAGPRGRYGRAAEQRL